MTLENPTWGQERIGDELSLKLGLLIDSRTIAKYLKQGRPPRRPPAQRWATFIRYQASAILACDLFVSVTATFQVLYVFVAMKIGSRRILHCNATAHPTAEWTRQQFCEFLDGESGHRYVLHDWDSIFSRELDKGVTDLGVRVFRLSARIRENGQMLGIQRVAGFRGCIF